MMEEFKQIVSPQKSIDDLVGWLRRKTTVTKIDFSCFSKSLITMISNNAVNAITNQKTKANKEDLEFVCFKVEDSKYKLILDVTHEEFIYVIIERKTGYILSNCNELYFELVLTRGVTQEDIDSHTMYMQYYLHCLRAYQGKEY